MALENKLLQKILYRHNDFCCLCFKTLMKDDFVDIDDEMSVKEETIRVADIMTFILPIEVPFNIATNGICSQCSKQAVTSYIFKKMCRDNWEIISNTIDTLSAFLDYKINNNHYSETLFITLDTTGFSSKEDCSETRTRNKNKLVNKKIRPILQNKTKLGNCSEIKSNLTKADNNIYQDNSFQISNRNKRSKIRLNQLHTVCLSEILYDKNDSKNYKCKVCHNVYPTSFNLKQHFVRVHAPKVFKCPQCSRRYGSAWILEQHRYESHSNLVCSHCGKKYNNRHSLKVHEMGHIIKWACQVCGREYKRKSTYNKHITLGECNRPRKSSSDAKFTCDLCGKKFCQKSTLRVHITFEHGEGKGHECIWCKKRFYAKSKLNAHIVKHTKDKNFACLQCGGKFVSKESLLYHTRIHTGDKPYKCNFCNERFVSASRRLDHVKRKHNTETHECEICHSKFKLKSCLMKHQKKHFYPISQVCSDLTEQNDYVDNIHRNYE